MCTDLGLLCLSYHSKLIRLCFSATITRRLDNILWQKKTQAHNSYCSSWSFSRVNSFPDFWCPSAFNWLFVPILCYQEQSLSSFTPPSIFKFSLIFHFNVTYLKDIYVGLWHFIFSGLLIRFQCMNHTHNWSSLISSFGIFRWMDNLKYLWSWVPNPRYLYFQSFTIVLPI